MCPEPKLAGALAAMRKGHSYEEPAFDVYPLKALPGSGGEGRVGELNAPVSLQEFATLVKRDLRTAGVQVVGEPGKSVRRVAIACGAAGEFLSDAAKTKADVFLTGEMRFHDYLSAQDRGIALVLPGHYATERPAVEELAERLQQEFAALTVWASRQETDPVTWV